MRFLIAFVFLFFSISLSAQVWKGAGIMYTQSAPSFDAPSKGSWVAVDTSSGYWYEWDKSDSVWVEMGARIQFTGTTGQPNYTPDQQMSRVAVNSGDSLYVYQTPSWSLISGGAGGAASDNQVVDTFTIVGNTLRLSLEDDAQPYKSVDLSPYLDDTDTQLTEEQVEDYAGGMVTGNTETLITVTYQDADGTIDFVVDNDLANYSNATSQFLTSEVDGSTSNEIQNVDTLVLTGTTLGISLSSDGVVQKTVDLASLQDGIGSSNGVAGYIPVFDGVSSIDTTSIYYNTTNGRIDIGTPGTAHTAPLQIETESTTKEAIVIAENGSLVGGRIFYDGALVLTSDGGDGFIFDTDEAIGGGAAATGSGSWIMTSAGLSYADSAPDAGLDLTAFTDAILVPRGNSGARPANAAGGFRYNTTLQSYEGYTITEWLPFVQFQETGSARLKAISTTQGFLPPVMTEAQRDAIVTPDVGLQLVNSSDSLPYFWNGTAYVAMYADGTGTDEQGLTIGGSGPTYTVDISGGSDVTIEAAGIATLSESTANVLTITATEVDGSTTNEIQTIDTFDISSNTLRASLSSDGQPFKSVDLSPYLDNTDAQGLTIGGSGPTYTIDVSGGDDVTIAAAGISTLSEGTANVLTITSTEVDGSTTNEIQDLSYTASTGAVGISGGGVGTTIPVMTASTRGLTPDGDGAGTDEFLREDGSWAVPPGADTDDQSLTIGGAGPSYIIEIDGGSDVTVSAGGIVTLSEGTANVLSITGTEVDGSVTNEIQSISVTGTTTATIDLSDDATDASITGAGISTVSVAGNAITITSTEVDGSTTNEIQDLSYTAATGAIGISDGGTGTTIPVMTSTTRGLVPDPDGSGTDEFLREDGTFAAPDFASGTYTPTLTGVANVASSTAYVCQYMRIGTVVTVSGKVEITPTTGNTFTQLGISLPISSNLTTDEQCSGSAGGKTTLVTAALILGDSSNDRAELDTRPAAGAQPYYFTFTYQVL